MGRLRIAKSYKEVSKKRMCYLSDSSNVFKLDVKILTDMASRMIPKNFRKM